jgi:hypothetical protein
LGVGVWAAGRVDGQHEAKKVIDGSRDAGIGKFGGSLALRALRR